MPPHALRVLPHIPAPRELYRAYLRNLRYIPDPHVWAQLAPRYRKLMVALRKPLPPVPAAYASSLPEARGASGPSASAAATGTADVKGKMKAHTAEEAAESMEGDAEEAEDMEGSPWNTAQSAGTRSKRKVNGAGGGEKTDEELWEDYVRAREVRYREIRKAKTDLIHLRQAVAVHPHALLRLLKLAYGQKGKIRWELLKNITESSPMASTDWKHTPPKPPCYPPRTLQPLPPAVRCLQPKIHVRMQGERLKPVPQCRLDKAKREQWQRAWSACGVPLALPPNPHGTATGWERLNLEDTLRVLAGLTYEPEVALPLRVRKREAEKAAAGKPAAEKPAADKAAEEMEPDKTAAHKEPENEGKASVEEAPKENDSSSTTAPPPSPPSIHNPRSLPTYALLRSDLARLFPKRLRNCSPPDAYPKPRPSVMRENSKLWSDPSRMDARMLRRVYKRFYDELPRVRVVVETENELYDERKHGPQAGEVKAAGTGEGQAKEGAPPTTTTAASTTVTTTATTTTDATSTSTTATTTDPTPTTTAGTPSPPAPKKKKPVYPEPRTMLRWGPYRPNFNKEDVLAVLVARFRPATDEEMAWWTQSATFAARKGKGKRKLSGAGDVEIDDVN